MSTFVTSEEQPSGAAGTRGPAVSEEQVFINKALFKKYLLSVVYKRGILMLPVFRKLQKVNHRPLKSPRSRRRGKVSLWEGCKELCYV